MGALVKIWYLLLFVLIVGIFLWGNVYHLIVEERLSLHNYYSNPEKYGGYKRQNFGKVINISRDSFYFDLGEADIKVLGSGVKKDVYGETVAFLDYGKDGNIRLIDYHNYDYNYFLYFISLFALIVFVVFLFKEWKITLKGFKDA